MGDTERRASNVPEAGQWPDKFTVPALALGAVLTTVGFLLAFIWVGPVNGASVNGFALIGDRVVTNIQLMSQKIFYFHMPVAIVSFVMMALAAYYAVRFLISKHQRYDTCARVALEVALLFVIATMVTGDLWTRFEWGVWWTWEPRLTTYLILMLLIFACFVLRNSIDEPERRAVYSSAVTLFAFIDVPVCMMITRLIPSSLHPVVAREGGMTPDMAITVALIMVGMLLVGFALYRTRFRQVRVTERVQALKEQLDDESAWNL